MLVAFTLYYSSVSVKNKTMKGAKVFVLWYQIN